MKTRLRELAPAARGSKDAGSRNLVFTFQLSAVDCLAGLANCSISSETSCLSTLYSVVYVIVRSNLIFAGESRLDGEGKYARGRNKSATLFTQFLAHNFSLLSTLNYVRYLKTLF